MRRTLWLFDSAPSGPHSRERQHAGPGHWTQQAWRSCNPLA